MNWNRRYASGSSLEKTAKEALIDHIDAYLDDEMDEAVCRDMKKLNVKTLRHLADKLRVLSVELHKATHGE